MFGRAPCLCWQPPLVSRRWSARCWVAPRKCMGCPRRTSSVTIPWRVGGARAPRHSADDSRPPLRAVAELYFDAQTETTVRAPPSGWLRRRLHLTTGFVFENFRRACPPPHRRGQEPRYRLVGGSHAAGPRPVPPVPALSISCAIPEATANPPSVRRLWNTGCSASRCRRPTG